MSAGVTFRRAYAVDVDGVIVGFVRRPNQTQWDAYVLDGGLVAVGLASRSEAADWVVARSLTS